MPVFNVRDSFGNAMTFGPNYKGVEIILDPVGLHGFRDHHILSTVLASKREIDEAIDNLISELETIRTIAAQKLESRSK